MLNANNQTSSAPAQSDADDSADTDAAPSDSAGGYCIELRVTADGKMSIGVEPLAEEQSEEGAEDGSGEGDDDNYQPVASLGGAIRLIKNIVAHAGDKTDMTAGQNDMDGGYQ